MPEESYIQKMRAVAAGALQRSAEKLTKADRAKEEPKTTALSEMLEAEGFMEFMEGMDEFEKLDTTGSSKRDNERIKTIFEAFQQFPQVVKDIQELWQSKAEARKVKISPEGLKKIETELLSKIKTGEIEVVKNFSAQLKELKELPATIEAKKKQIALMESISGTRGETVAKKEQMLDKVNEADKKLAELAEAREAKEVMDTNKKNLGETQNFLGKIIGSIQDSRLANAWRLLENNPDVAMVVLGSEMAKRVFSLVKGLEKIGDPEDLLKKIEEDGRLANQDSEAQSRREKNINILLQLVKHPKIKGALNKMFLMPESLDTIEQLETDPAAQTNLTRERQLESAAEKFLMALKDQSLKDLASSPANLEMVLNGASKLLKDLGSSPAGQRLQTLAGSLMNGVNKLSEFASATLNVAAQIESLAGLKPEIGLREFFIKHGPRQRGHALRQSEAAQKHIETLDQANHEKIELEAKYELAQEAIFRSFPAAEGLVEELLKQVDKKFENLLSDNSSLKSHFEASDYFAELVQTDEQDDEFDITAQMNEVKDFSGKNKQEKVSKSKIALAKKVCERMAKEIKTALAPMEAKAVTPKNLEKMLIKMRVALGEEVTGRPEYEKIEKAAIVKVYQDPTVKASKRKSLENLFPELRRSVNAFSMSA